MTYGEVSRELLTEWQETVDRLSVPAHVFVTMESALEALSNHHMPTVEHSMRVGIKAAQIGEQLDMDQKPLFYGGTLHDYGKICVPSALLAKTAVWTTADARALRNHPLDGYKKVMEAGMPVTAGIVVRHHTFQPNAYPEHPPELPSTLPACLGDFVVRNARIVALADYYDAAHRNDSTDNLNGEEIRAKVRSHNGDLIELVDKLYDSGVFSLI